MSRPFRKSKWDTPKSYGNAQYPASSTSLSGPPVSSLEAASAAAAKINAVLAAKGKLQLPSTKAKESEKSRTSQNELVVAEIEINDVPVYCRNMLTKRTMQDTISRETGAAVSTRGRYMTESDKLSNATGDRSLYLFVQALTKDKVDLAVERIVGIIKNVSHSTAADPKVTYKNLSENVTLGNPLGVKQPLGGVPAVGNVFQEKIFIGLEHAHPSFNVKEKIQGPGGSFLNHIRMETGASVYLRGKGSGLMERASGRESFENLYIFITHQKQENLQAAKKLCENLVQTIQAEYSKYQAQMMTGTQPQIAVSSGGTPQGLPTSYQNVVSSLGVRPILPSTSQAAVVTVGAQTTPLVSTGVPVHSASSQASQPVSMQQVTVPASSGVVVSVNNAVAYPHLQRFQVAPQQPALIASPVPVGLPSSVPRRVALLIQPQVTPGVQQPPLPSGVVVGSRIPAMVHPPGTIQQPVPVGIPPPITLIPQRPPLASEAIASRLSQAGIVSQAPGTEIRMAVFPPQTTSGAQDKQVIHLQTPPTLIQQVSPGQPPQMQHIQTATSQQPLPPHIPTQPQQQSQPVLESHPHAVPPEPAMQAAQQLPDHLHPQQGPSPQVQSPQLPVQVHQLQQILPHQGPHQGTVAHHVAAAQHAVVQHAAAAAAAAQQVAAQQAVVQQVTAQQSAAQQSVPQQVMLQQGPPQQSITHQVLPQSQGGAQQTSQVQHQVISGSQSIFQAPQTPGQLPAHAHPPQLQGTTVRLAFHRVEQQVLTHPQQIPRSATLSLPQQAPGTISSSDTGVAVAGKTVETQIMSISSVPQLQEQQATSQAPLTSVAIPLSISSAPVSYTQNHPVSSHLLDTPASSGLLPLPPPPVQYSVPSSSVAPTTVVVAAQRPVEEVMQFSASNGKEREVPPASRMQEDGDSPFARRRRFREDFELDEKPPKSFRSSEFESTPYSRRFKTVDSISEAARDLGRRSSDLFGRRRRVQEAGEVHPGFEDFQRDRELRRSRFTDTTDRRLMPPPPTSLMAATGKGLLPSPKMTQSGIRRSGSGPLEEGSPQLPRSLVSYDAGDSDSDSDESGGSGMFGSRSSQNRFDHVRGVSQSPPHAGHYEQQSHEVRYGQSPPTNRFSPPSSLRHSGGSRLQDLPPPFQEHPTSSGRGLRSPRAHLMRFQGPETVHSSSQSVVGQPFWMARH